MFPSVFIENTETKSESENVGIDFSFDYTTGQHIMKGFVLNECTQLETVRQYIQNVLRTQANIYGVYVKGETEIFGITVYEHIGTKKSLSKFAYGKFAPTVRCTSLHYHLGYVNSELKREVTELLLKHPLIKDVSKWNGVREKRGLNISFTVTRTDNSLITFSEEVTEVGYV